MKAPKYHDITPVPRSFIIECGRVVETTFDNDKTPVIFSDDDYDFPVKSKTRAKRIKATEHKKIAKDRKYNSICIIERTRFYKPMNRYETKRAINHTNLWDTDFRHINKEYSDLQEYEMALDIKAMQEYNRLKEEFDHLVELFLNDEIINSTIKYWEELR